MPQMKPMKWLIIFILSMINLLFMMILINTIPLKMKNKQFKLKKIFKKKWMWLL